jgi:DNA mismatch repair protein MutS2
VNFTPSPDPWELVRASELELDWPLLLDQLAQHAISAAAARSLRARRPLDDFEAACQSMRLSEQALSLYASGDALPVENFPDTAELLERIERGTLATGLELRDVQQLLEQARRLRAVAHAERSRRSLLAAALDSDPTLEQVAERLARSLESDGTLSDAASDELGRARRKLADARRDLTAQLRRLLVEYADILRESYWAERGGRAVLPLRADAHRALDGAVLDSSGSGGTLYVEPRELLPFNNRLRLCEAEVHHEEQRVLRQLSDLVARRLLAVRAAESACIQADELQAIARFSERTRAVPIVPSAEPLIDLKQARHPLLASRNDVVANDLALPAGCGLVISGPNAGGKTVLLKLVGLAAGMVRSGIPLPAGEGSQMGFFEPILCNLGDAQSIASSLSTFSAHVTDLAAILSLATPRMLVLLDEVAAGTDPEEGAALAAAVLEALTERGATVMTTTHHEPLKELATRHPRLRSAAVGFDLQSMLPTFRLLPNVAGPSTALAVASRFGMPESVLARAYALIPQTSRDREQLLRELLAERSAAEQARREVEAELVQQRSLRLQLERERQDFDARESRALQAQYRELMGSIVQARAELAELHKRLKQQAITVEGLREAEQSIDAAAHVIAMGSAVSSAAQPRGADAARQPDIGELAVGSRVHVPKWGVSAEVVEMGNKGAVRVVAGSLRAWLALSELRLTAKGAPSRPVRTAAPTKPHKPAARAPGTEPIRKVAVRVDSNTLDLRGARVDEALDRLDAFVDKLLNSGEHAAFVLHGHGTGALKQAVREHLKLSRHVLDSEPAEPEDGGDAFTVFWVSD